MTSTYSLSSRSQIFDPADRAEYLSRWVGLPTLPGPVYDAGTQVLDLQDVVVERPVLEMMQYAKHRRSIRVINGLKTGTLTRALQGEDVGTLIYAD